MLTIALVGLPSAGKSSIINSLVGRRVAESGICRTTLESKLYSGLTSDDGISYCIYDLPGICDIEDKDKKFNEIVFDIIRKCNVVFWISDINKAFITNHELQEFKKIENYLKELSAKECIPVKLAIILSKVDDNLTSEFIDDEKFDTCVEGETDDELENDEINTEETTARDIYTKIKANLPNIKISCFNAHGRSYYHKASSSKLRDFVRQFKPKHNNVDFLLKAYADLLPKLNQYRIKQFFTIKMQKFLAKGRIACNTTNIEMPDKLVLYCPTSKCLAIKCKNKDCETCEEDKYEIRCKMHEEKLVYNHNYYDCDYGRSRVMRFCNSELNSTYAIPTVSTKNYQFTNKAKTTTCEEVSEMHGVGCSFQNFGGAWDKILCQHGYNVRKCYGYYTTEVLSKISTELLETFDAINTEEATRKLIEFILYDGTKDIGDLLDFIKHKYDSNIWNMLCSHITIDVKRYYNYLEDYKNLTSNQIYRLIQIGKDLTLEDKLFLYSLPQATTLAVGLKQFMVENIYNLEYFESGKMFEIKDWKMYESVILHDNKRYEKEIYKTSLLEKVKGIRRRIFGEIEDDIRLEMLPIAYTEYGLFWRP